jgi:hypothetical protein
MKKRAWVSATIQTEVEWDDKDDLGYIDALKADLSKANIAEFSGTEVEEKTTEYFCETCQEWKRPCAFYKNHDECCDCYDAEEMIRDSKESKHMNREFERGQL